MRRRRGAKNFPCKHFRFCRYSFWKVRRFHSKVFVFPQHRSKKHPSFSLVLTFVSLFPFSKNRCLFERKLFSKVFFILTSRPFTILLADWFVSSRISFSNAAFTPFSGETILKYFSYILANCYIKLAMFERYEAAGEGRHLQIGVILSENFRFFSCFWILIQLFAKKYFRIGSWLWFPVWLRFPKLW